MDAEKRGEAFTKAVTALCSLWLLAGGPCYVISCWAAMRSDAARLHCLSCGIRCDSIKWMGPWNDATSVEKNTKKRYIVSFNHFLFVLQG